MTKETNDTIRMIWRNKKGESFKVEELCRQAEKYYFKYDIDGVEKAKDYGFYPLPNLPRIDVEYFREELFQSFSKRLPLHGKKGISSVLKQYDLKTYDAFELLKKSGGKISTDSFEFVAPFDSENTSVD